MSGSREDVSPWLIALTVGETDGEPSPVFVPMAASFNLDTATAEEFADVAGWSVLDVDTFVEQATPPTTFSVVTDDFAGNALADDLVETDDGIVSDKDGEDFEVDLDDITALSKVGQPVRLAQDGDRIALSTSTPTVRAWLDGKPSLAETSRSPPWQMLLDGRDVMSAVLTRATGGEGPATSDIPGEPFDAVGIGWSVEEDAGLVHAALPFRVRRRCGRHR
jgi:hypothetical protein